MSLKVAIIGDGLLGRTIFDILAPRESDGTPPRTVLYSHDDLDVTSLDSIVHAFRVFQPDVAINTAAYHRLPECEANPDIAWNVNAKGAGRVASLVPTVYISTDYVFNDKGPHDESVPGERPVSEYGRSKLAGELETMEHDGIVVRVAGLFGHHPSHKGPTFPERVMTGWDILPAPRDQRFTPTYAPDAAERVVDLAVKLATKEGDCCGEADPCHGCSRPTGIYHATNSGSTTWAEFAQQISEVSRHPRLVKPIDARDPLRPKDSRLVSRRLPPLPHWRLALTRWSIEDDRRRAVVSPLRAS